MKKMFLLLIFSFALLSFSNNPYPVDNDNTELQTSYCSGWASGYCEGWKDVKGVYAICPVTPICPIANIGQDTYKDGYNRGFKAGRAAAKK